MQTQRKPGVRLGLVMEQILTGATAGASADPEQYKTLHELMCWYVLECEPSCNELTASRARSLEQIFDAFAHGRPLVKEFKVRRPFRRSASNFG